MSAPSSCVLSSDPATQRILDFNPAAVIREAIAEAAKLSPEERRRNREALEKAKLVAALYLARGADPAGRASARAFLRRTRGAA